MRSELGAETHRCKWHRDKILLPFVANLRQEFDGFDGDINQTIPEALTVGSWCDGDLG